jgi:hypothetical protein
VKSHRPRTSQLEAPRLVRRTAGPVRRRRSQKSARRSDAHHAADRIRWPRKRSGRKAGEATPWLTIRRRSRKVAGAGAGHHLPHFSRWSTPRRYARTPPSKTVVSAIDSSLHPYRYSDGANTACAPTDANAPRHRGPARARMAPRLGARSPRSPSSGPELSIRFCCD